MSDADAKKVWDARYLAGDTPWDKGAAHPELPALLAAMPLASRVLLPGCGTGHDVRSIAHLLRASVLGLDLSREALTRAEAFPKVGREEYRLSDFLELPSDLKGAFDLLVEHTCFCAIQPEERDAYVQSAAAALVPGGKLAAIFYKEPDLDPSESGPPFGVTDEELNERFDRDFQLLARWMPAKTFEGREGCEECRVYERR